MTSLAARLNEFHQRKYAAPACPPPDGARRQELAPPLPSVADEIAAAHELYLKRIRNLSPIRPVYEMQAAAGGQITPWTCGHAEKTSRRLVPQSSFVWLQQDHPRKSASASWVETQQKPKKAAIAPAKRLSCPLLPATPSMAEASFMSLMVAPRGSHKSLKKSRPRLPKMTRKSSSSSPKPWK